MKRMKRLLSKVKSRYLLLAFLVALFAFDMADGELDTAAIILEVLMDNGIEEPPVLETVDAGTGEGTGHE